MSKEYNIFDNEYVQEKETESPSDTEEKTPEEKDETNPLSPNTDLSRPKRRIIRGKIIRD